MGKFNEEFKYATNLLLDDKLKLENAEDWSDYGENIEHSLSLHCKTIVYYKLPCFEGPYCSGLTSNNFYGKIKVSNIFENFVPKITFFRLNNILDILYIKNLVVNLFSLHFQLYNYILFVHI